MYVYTSRHRPPTAIIFYIIKSVFESWGPEFSPFYSILAKVSSQEPFLHCNSSVVSYPTYFPTNTGLDQGFWSLTLQCKSDMFEIEVWHTFGIAETLTSLRLFGTRVSSQRKQYISSILEMFEMNKKMTIVLIK